ncbi:MAG: glycosyltransferase [Duncaniella sp.]|nr:glycosyltransferase [Duncaniella sp.]
MNSESPLVSVLIITYNQEDTIACAIDSVLEQKGGIPYEIIIGDDASTDRTRQICLGYAVRYPDIIRLMPEAPNKGLVDNYFDCLETARGKYIADCAGDDHWCDPDKLASMTGMLENNPDATVAYSDTIVRWPDGTEEFSSDTGKRPFCLPETLRAEGKDVLSAVLNSVNALPYVLSSAVYRRDAVMKILRERSDIVRNRQFGIEDVPVIAALASQGAALHYPVPTLVYEQRQESVSNSASPAKMVNFYARSLECTRQLAEYYKVPQQTLKENFDAKSRYIAGMAFNSGNEAAMTLVSDTLGRWNLRLPFSVRLHMLAFRFAPLRGFVAALKRLLGR